MICFILLILLEYYSMDEAASMLNDRFYGSYESEVDFAIGFLDECSEKLPDNLMAYFDYDAYAHDLFIDDFESFEFDGSTFVFSRY